MYNQIKNKKFNQVLNKNNIVIEEYIDNDDCYFKCIINSNKKNIIKNIQNVEILKKNPLVIDIVKEGNIFYSHVESPAPLLGIDEQEFIYKLQINELNDQFIEIKSLDKKSVFEDTERSHIKYLVVETMSDKIQIYTLINPSQKIVGNKHITYLRNFLYNFLKSIR